MLPHVLAALALQSPWPAEPWSSAQNLTAVEGAGTNDFHEDLSGAAWNPLTRRLWLCRNGPSDSTSKLWVLREDGAGSFVVDTRAGNRGEWTSFGDFEAVTQADYAEDTVYALAEGVEQIREYDVSTYGTAILRRTWNADPFLPQSGGLGSEGLTFVPDAFLSAQGFVDGAGQPRTSARGMGGLMLVGHQNGGRVYAFDLDRASGAFDFVGAYRTGESETAELCFDRSTGQLLALHGEGVNRIEVLSLASVVVGAERQLVSIATYLPPTGAPGTPNLEGLAVVSVADCYSGDRSLFLTVDDGGANSLFRFREFACGTPPTSASATCFGDGSLPTACPCANNGSAGNGCANSQNVRGARLDAITTGTPDSLDLLASGLPPTSFVVFAGSATANASGIVFGDGLRCVGGSIVRLRSRNAVAGFARVGPGVGDPSIRSLTSAQPGSTWIHQAFYRDASPSFCTSGTLNASSGQSVSW